MSSTVQDLAALRAPFDHLAADIRARAKGRPIVYFQNPGNFGDSLINFGAELFFQDAGFDIRHYPMNDRKEKLRSALLTAQARINGNLVVYGGSGAWCKATYIARRIVLMNSTITSNLLVLPSTYEDFVPPRKVRAYARDRFESLNRLEDKNFCHDMAFYMALVDEHRILPDRTPPSEELGLFFRIDNEARPHGFAQLPGNYDLSADGSHLSNPMEFLRHLDRYETVATDRLHIAIGAAILGKTVLIATGNYFKIRAIYDTSVAPHFPKCRLVEDAEMRDVVSAGKAA